MNCPYCNDSEIKVIDSRESKDGSSIKRRRECFGCSKRFSTIEKILKLDLEVKKSNGDIEVFNLQKIKRSLLKACEKRPVTLEQIEELTENILKDLKKVEESSIPTSTVGSIVLRNLKDVDEIAFLRFIIVHNDYQNLSEFMDEVGKLKNFDGLTYKRSKEKVILSE
ncbi:MAG: transcriptional regulator NrdR [Candidatus Woesearchaeota archaeon]|jgi:transcriptional repressor NrdR|nr:transcriptional regulator NrdR [Candidatus Woesearchaeota archaeon]